MFTTRNSGGLQSGKVFAAKSGMEVAPEDQENVGHDGNTSALTGTLIGVFGTVLVAALVLGVVIPYVRRRKEEKKTSSNPATDNPAFTEKA